MVKRGFCETDFKVWNTLSILKKFSGFGFHLCHQKCFVFILKMNGRIRVFIQEGYDICSEMNSDTQTTPNNRTLDVFFLNLFRVVFFASMHKIVIVWHRSHLTKWGGEAIVQFFLAFFQATHCSPRLWPVHQCAFNRDTPLTNEDARLSQWHGYCYVLYFSKIRNTGENTRFHQQIFSRNILSLN